jgi:hypothetical protein
MITIAETIYVLCAATSLIAASLLLRHYTVRRTRLLLWSCIGFFGLAVNNVLVFIDLGVLPGSDLSVPRTLAGAVAMLVLVYGLIWEAGQ